MYFDVIEVHITRYLEFTVTFADGLTGTVTLLPSHLYGVFTALKDPGFFNQLSVSDGFVSWPNDIDLAPDAMYQAINRDGKWVLQ